MSQELINLTLSLVIQEVEDILDAYPDYSYQVAFSSQELRHKLIIEVLGQVPNYYAIVEDAKQLPTDPRVLYSSLEERVRMESLIRKSIVFVFHDNANSLSSPIPQRAT